MIPDDLERLSRWLVEHAGELDQLAILASISANHCPDCGAARSLKPGARGGAAVNLRCVNCGSRFNVAGTRETGLVFAQRI